MMYINILHSVNRPLFAQQFDVDRFGNSFHFSENSDEDRLWDGVVVFEDFRQAIQLRCREGGLLFVAGEPPMGSVYAGGFLSQFDVLWMVRPGISTKGEQVQRQHFNDWHFGYDSDKKEFRYSFDALKQMPVPEKTKNISVITSSLAQLPMHLQRLDFLKAVKKELGDAIDFYGRGSNEVTVKADALLDYRFHLCIENVVQPDNWTEKLADPILGYAVPVYIGCTNVSVYFPEDAVVMLDIRDVKGSVAKLRALLADPEGEYARRLDALKKARELVLHEYQLLPSLAAHFEKVIRKHRPVRALVIRPNSSFVAWKVKNVFLRLKRFIYKLSYQLVRITK